MMCAAAAAASGVWFGGNLVYDSSHIIVPKGRNWGFTIFVLNLSCK
jgi:hypothetical protein